MSLDASYKTNVSKHFFHFVWICFILFFDRYLIFVCLISWNLLHSCFALVFAWCFLLELCFCSSSCYSSYSMLLLLLLDITAFVVWRYCSSYSTLLVLLHNVDTNPCLTLSFLLFDMVVIFVWHCCPLLDVTTILCSTPLLLLLNVVVPFTQCHCSSCWMLLLLCSFVLDATWSNTYLLHLWCCCSLLNIVVLVAFVSNWYPPPPN